MRTTRHTPKNVDIFVVVGGGGGIIVPDMMYKRRRGSAQSFVLLCVWRPSSKVSKIDVVRHFNTRLTHDSLSNSDFVNDLTSFHIQVGRRTDTEDRDNEYRSPTHSTIMMLHRKRLFINFLLLAFHQSK
jgi:hypothetical protein